MEHEPRVPNASTLSPTPSAPSRSHKAAEASAKPVRRACDCCRKRKVRCDFGQPCTPCRKASIRCAYLQPAKKKGPKGLRSARVLHALRNIDDEASRSQAASLSPEQHHVAFGNWRWDAATSSPRAPHPPDHTAPGAAPVYVPPSSLAPDQRYYAQTAPSSAAAYAHPQPQRPLQPQLYREDSHHSSWSSRPDHNNPNGRTPPSITDRTGAQSPQQRFPARTFPPYVQLFCRHMFAIMPVIDRNIYLDPILYEDSELLSPDIYCLLCALCAATIVQLDASIPQPAPLRPGCRSDDLLAEECLRERTFYDYVAAPSALSCLTSYFLFVYHGNHESHAKAWFYLQEAITFAENLNMDDDASYARLDPVEAQWRRRLYWLLFVTERAYAVQRRKHTRLHASVQLPSAFESEDRHLLNGFINIANLFAVVDDNFVAAWRGSRRQSLCDEAWLAKTQKQLDTAAMALENVSETQHLDISVTREWLHVLVWQVGVSNGLIWGNGQGGMRLDYPIELARKVVEITAGANSLALDSNGIGMEQKLSDIAACVADVLRCTADSSSAMFIEGKQYLGIILQKLSSIRGRESRYWKPLMSKMEGLSVLEQTHQSLAQQQQQPPSDATASTHYQQHLSSEYLSAAPRFSIADSVGMLRTLSMSGNLGMPPLMVPVETSWQQRRPSGRVYDEAETNAMASWLVAHPANGTQTAP